MEHESLPGAGAPLSVVEELLAEGLELEAEPRRVWLDELRGRDAGLAAAVEEHLERLAELGLGLEPAGPGPVRLAHYLLERCVGAGGMGEVWRARDLRDGRVVALKLVRPDLVRFEGARRRFGREARAAGSLEHPALVRVLEAGEEDGLPWMALEWVEGASLDRLLEALRGRRASRLVRADLVRALRAEVGGRAAREEDFEGEDWPACVALLLAQVADGLEHAHRHGVLHRDVKPSNVLVALDGRALLTDFGLAHSREASRMTRSGSWLGSLPWSSPEQVEGRAGHDARVDVYSLGATLYEALTLRTPFLGGSEESVRLRIRTGELARPRAIDPGLPRALERVCRRAMDPDPRRRHASAAALASDLRAAARGERVWARELPVAVRLARTCRRHARMVAAGVVATLMLGTAVAWALYERGVAARVRRMADSELVARLEREADGLWPADPGRSLAIEAWLVRADELLDRRDEHEASLAALRAEALPGGEAPAQLARTREELVGILREVESLIAFLAGQAPRAPRDVQEADERAWELVGRGGDELEAALEGALAEARERARRHGLARDLEQLETLEREARARARELGRRSTWTFAREFDQWRHDELAQLVERLAGLEDRVAEVRGLAARARDLAEAAPALARAWEPVLADLDSRGLVLRPFADLLPLRVDPASGLWEFLLLGSGEAPALDPLTDRWRIDGDSGLVLVLLPGGEVELGAPDDAPAALGASRPRYRVRLDPYLVARTELTLGQARRLGWREDVPQGEAREDWPVRMDWEGARRLLAAHGLEHPSEARWEHAAGSGDEVLAGPGPVARGAPGVHGLHDTCGNVREWCADPMVLRGHASLAPRPGDGLRWTALEAPGRAVRGSDPPGFDAAGDGGRWRTVARSLANPAIAPETGVRPVRSVVGRREPWSPPAAWPAARGRGR